MAYILEEFVHNKYNVVYQLNTHTTAEKQTLEYKQNFEHNIEYDTCNESAAPIYVYERNGEPIAWFNTEDLTAFIKV